MMLAGGCTAAACSRDSSNAALCCAAVEHHMLRVNLGLHCAGCMWQGYRTTMEAAHTTRPWATDLMGGCQDGERRSVVDGAGEVCRGAGKRSKKVWVR